MAQSDQVLFPVSETAVFEMSADFREMLCRFSDKSEEIERIVDRIVSKYAEKQRVYHNLSHISRMLFQARNLKEQFADFESVRLAIWFHDAVYNPKRTTNESESASLAAGELSRLNFPADKIGKIESMIFATQKHDAANLDFDGRLFLDLDLSILGQTADVYDRYKQAIRREYSFVPWFLYKRSRRKILENFLAREFVYFTEEIRQTCEAAARRNVRREIDELS